MRDEALKKKQKEEKVLCEYERVVKSEKTDNEGTVCRRDEVKQRLRAVVIPVTLHTKT